MDEQPQEITFPEVPLPLNNTERIEYLEGLIPTEDIAPTYMPAKFVQQYRIVGNGGSSAVYINDTKNGRWIGPLIPSTTVTDATISTSDITTNDVSTAKHGWTPKAPNDTAKFLRGDATWAAPAGIASQFYQLVAFHHPNSSVSTLDTTNYGTIPVCRFLRVVIYIPGSSGATTDNITFNNDTTSIYAYRTYIDFTLDQSAGASPAFRPLDGLTTIATGRYCVIDINNVSGKMKSIISNTANQADASTAAPLKSYYTIGKWNSTSQITRITVTPADAGTYDTGSFIDVYGIPE